MHICKADAGILITHLLLLELLTTDMAPSSFSGSARILNSRSFAWHSLSLHSREGAAWALSSGRGKSKCCCSCPPNRPALAPPRPAVIQSPSFMGKLCWSSHLRTSPLNFCSPCVPLPHNWVLKGFLVLSVFMFIIVFVPHVCSSENWKRQLLFPF